MPNYSPVPEDKLPVDVKSTNYHLKFTVLRLHRSPGCKIAGRDTCSRTIIECLTPDLSQAYWHVLFMNQ